MRRACLSIAVLAALIGAAPASARQMRSGRW